MLRVLQSLFSEQLNVELFVPFVLMVLIKSTVTMAGIPYVQGRLIDAFNSINLDEPSSMSMFRYFLILYCTLYCLGSLAYMSYKYIELIMLSVFELKTRKRTLHKHILNNRSYDWKTKLDRCLNEIKILPKELSHTIKDLFNNLLPSAIASVTGIAFLTYIDLWLGALVLLVFALVTVAVYFIYKNQSGLKTFYEDYEEVDNKIADTISNIVSVYVYKTMFAEIHDLDACEETLSQKKRGVLMNNNHIITAWQTSMVLIVFPFVYRLYVILKNRRIQSGLFITALITFFLIDSHLLKAVIASKHIIQQVASVEYFDRHSTDHDIGSECLVSSDKTMACDEVFVFDNVTFGYVDGRTVLDNMSFVARKNEITCIVGPPGSGKSTIVSLLFKKMVPHSGTIRMYDQEDYSPSNMTLVSQMAILFNRSVYDNITYGTNATKQDVEDIILQFQLDTVFGKLANGMDTMCGFQGRNLSGGQKQMVHVMRSILSNSNVIVMDEPTSALDNTTIGQYIRVIQHLKGIKHCVLVITHDSRVMNIADNLIRI